MEFRRNRRRFLWALAVASVALSGCLGGRPADDEQAESLTDRPQAEPSETDPSQETQSSHPAETDGGNDDDDHGGDTQTPFPDTLSFEVSAKQRETVVEFIDQPSATDGKGNHSMAYLRSAADVERLNKDTLADKQQAFLAGTDFTKSVIVAIGLRYPTTVTETHVLDALRRPEGLEIRVRIDTHGGLSAEGRELFLVRVTPENGIPEAATVVFENDPYNDDEPTEFGTTDEST